LKENFKTRSLGRNISLALFDFQHIYYLRVDVGPLRPLANNA